MRKRKLTAWILVLAMVLSMFGGTTVSAFADGEETSQLTITATLGDGSIVEGVKTETVDMGEGNEISYYGISVPQGTDTVKLSAFLGESECSFGSIDKNNFPVVPKESAVPIIDPIKLMPCALIYFTTQSSGDENKGEESPGAAGDNPESVTVYVNLSHNGLPIIGNDEHKTPMASVPFTVEYFDLADYGLEKYYRYESDSFEDGGAYKNTTVVKTPTLLHLYIKLLEKYYLADGSKLTNHTDALDIGDKCTPTHLFMSKFWGYSGNLNYYVNHKFPLMYEGMGATADYILLEDNDVIDLGHFDYMNFWQDGAFVYFNNPVTELEVGEEATFSLKTISGMGGEMPVPSDLSIWHAESADLINDPTQVLLDSISDTSKPFTVSFGAIGTYYLMAVDQNMTTDSAKNAPAVTKLTVTKGSAVENVAVTGVELNKETITLEVDANEKLIATVAPIDATNKTIKWTSSDTKVASVDQQGVVTAVAEGSATITATTQDGDLTDTCEVTVNAVANNKIKLSAVRLYTGCSGRMEKTTFFKDEFEPNTFNYTLSDGYDIENTVRMAMETTDDSGAAVTVIGGQLEEPKTLEVSGVDKEAWNWMRLNTGKNEFSLDVKRIGTANEGIKYIFTRNILPTLTNLEVGSDGVSLPLDKNFEATTSEYAITISDELANLEVSVTPKSDDYTIKYNGQVSNNVNIVGKDSIDIEVIGGTGDNAVTNTYTIRINKVVPYNAKIIANPADATVSVYGPDNKSVDSDNGTYSLLPGNEYSYVVSKYGYVTKADIITGTDVLTDGKLNVTLSKAPEAITPLPNYTGDWINSRGNNENMGISSAKTPMDISDSSLKWAKKYGTSWSAAPTPPIIVNNNLYLAANGKVLKISKDTGEVIAENSIAGSLGFSLVTLAYGDGMIFVPISNGQIQAFRADTLESLWISEKIGGQTNSPIAYNDGYIYTGTWKRETEPGTFMGISVTDEDPTQSNEEKKASWKLKHKGGFYWAGAYATDKYVIVGSDDGTPEGDYSANGILYSIEPKTGKVIDTIDGIQGDIRSSVSYDKNTDALYCATKGGKFIKTKVDVNGNFIDSEYKTLEMGGMCTGTPLVYDGVAFLGVSGPSQFGTEGHKYKVIDVSKMEVIKDIPTKGYVQTSALLSTAYAEKKGKVYIYITYNQNPGGIDVIEYDVNTKESSCSDLFVPPDKMQQYCICSMVCDSEGTLYYKNDSCYLMAVENVAKTIEQKPLEVTAQEQTDFVNGKDANFKFTVENVGGEAIENAHMLTVLYDESTNKMITYNYVTKSLADGESCDWGAMLPIPETGRYKVKAFVWDTITNPTSLSNPVEVLMQ